MKQSNISTSFFLLAFILILSLLNIIIPTQDFSENENRFLAQRPNLTWDKLVSGKFTAQFEEYLTDQFVFRDFWISLKSLTEKAIQKKDNNGIYFGKDGFLLQKPMPIDFDLLEKNMQTLHKFVLRHASTPVYFLLAPNSTDILTNKLPFLAPTNKQEVLARFQQENGTALELINIFRVFQDKMDENIYYKTDHHWTSLGAYYAYQEIGKTMHFQPLGIEDFEIETITDDFYGTLYSKSGVRWVKPDTIEIFKPKKEIDYQVDYLDNLQSSSSLYAWEHLKKKDKYAVFLDGNHALVKISNVAAANKKLIIIKDSYAHNLVPFLTLHYNEIQMLDLRYFNQNVEQYLHAEQPDEILFVYNTLNFSEDNSLIKLNQKKD